MSTRAPSEAAESGRSSRRTRAGWAAGVRPPRRRFPAGFDRRSILWGSAPAVLLLSVFLGLPIALGLWLSLSSWGGAGDARWVGLDNYLSLFADGALWRSLAVTAEYAFVSTALIVAISLLLAVAVHGRLRGSRVYRALWFLPAIAPGAAVGVFWSLAFQPYTGIVNALSGIIGLDDDNALLADPSTALIPPIIATVWAGTGLAYVLILGALNSIPAEIYEAAHLDGASGLRRMWSITLPLIRPVLVTVTMLQLIWTANGFTIVWAMTRGGPGNSTSILPVFVYNQITQRADYGAAAAAATIGGAILIGIGLVMLRLRRTREDTR